MLPLPLPPARAFAKDPIISGSLSQPDEPRARDFRARLTRHERSRAVLETHRQRLRKRYAALFAALVIPAMASAADWPGVEAAPARAATHPGNASLQHADYTSLAYDPQIHSDADEPSVGRDVLGGPAAQAFRETGSGLDRARAEQCLTMAIYYEAATEPDDGQRAVAQVVLNRVAHPAYPDTVCGVVFQGSERATGCQFTFTCDGSLARRPMTYWWDRARQTARAALAGFVYAPVGLATNYHTTYVHPTWADSLLPVTTIGAHRFYRLPGAAGMAAAFRVAYLGGEPVAAPHPRAFAPPAGSNPDPVALARAYDTSLSTAAPAIQPRRSPEPSPAPIYSAAIEARGGDALFHVNNLPAAGELAPELQRSGQWLQRP
jgi:spore germination cell wall hydrolase CwlJ-like protein